MIRLKLLCNHEFKAKDIRLTNIAGPAKPAKNDGYKAWSEYLTAIYKHDSHTKRVSCNCAKCGELHYAHCGLDLKGKLI